MILSTTLLFGCTNHSDSVSFPKIDDFTGVHLSESVSLPEFEEIDSFNFFLQGHGYVSDWKECNPKKEWLYNSIRDYFKVERKFSGIRVGVGTNMFITESSYYLRNSDNDPFCTDERFELEQTSYEFARELKKCLDSHFDEKDP